MYCAFSEQPRVAVTQGKIPLKPLAVKFLIGGNVIEKKKESTITIRLNAKDKEKIKSLAKRCGLSVSQYVKQRALGYEPKGVPPDVLFCLIKKIGALENKTHLPKTDDEIRVLLSNITESLLLPQREAVS